MDTVEQLTPPEGPVEIVSSTEIGGQSILWKGRATSDGQLALADIPDEETAGSVHFKRARLEGTLKTNRRKLGKTTQHGTVPRKH